MKKVFLFFTMAAIVVASMSGVMADTAMKSAKSSPVAVNDIYEGEYLGYCTNVYMDSIPVPDADNVTFTVKAGGGIYYFYGIVDIVVVYEGHVVEHEIDFNNVEFEIDENGCITNATGSGIITIIVDGNVEDILPFDLDSLTGCFVDGVLNFHFEGHVPDFPTPGEDFTASFDFKGTKQ
jgi:hypothetical protein